MVMTGPTFAFPLSPVLLLFLYGYFSLQIGVSWTPCSWRSGGVTHVHTKRARGYRLHISINLSGLASLEWGLGSSDQRGAVISLVTAVSWQPEWRDRGREKIEKRTEWETDFEFPAVSTRGCGGDNSLTSQNEAMAILHTLTAAARLVIIVNAPCS